MPTTKEFVTNVFTKEFLATLKKYYPEAIISHNSGVFRTDPELHCFIKKYRDETGKSAFFLNTSSWSRTIPTLNTVEIPSCLIPFSQSIEVDDGNGSEHYTISFDIPLAMATATKEELSRTIDTTLPMADQLAQEREKQRNLLSRMEELSQAQLFVLERFKRT